MLTDQPVYTRCDKAKWIDQVLRNRHMQLFEHLNLFLRRFKCLLGSNVSE